MSIYIIFDKGQYHNYENTDMAKINRNFIFCYIEKKDDITHIGSKGKNFLRCINIKQHYMYDSDNPELKFDAIKECLRGVKTAEEIRFINMPDIKVYLSEIADIVGFKFSYNFYNTVSDAIDNITSLQRKNSAKPSAKNTTTQNTEDLPFPGEDDEKTAKSEPADTGIAGMPSSDKETEGLPDPQPETTKEKEENKEKENKEKDNKKDSEKKTDTNTQDTAKNSPETPAESRKRYEKLIFHAQNVEEQETRVYTDIDDAKAYLITMLQQRFTSHLHKYIPASDTLSEAAITRFSELLVKCSSFKEFNESWMATEPKKYHEIFFSNDDFFIPLKAESKYFIELSEILYQKDLF